MDVRREPVLELARVRREVHAQLAQLEDHHAHGPVVAAELARRQLLALPHAARNRPEQQVGHIGRHRLAETREPRCRVADLVGVALGLDRQDLELLDFLCRGEKSALTFIALKDGSSFTSCVRGVRLTSMLSDHWPASTIFLITLISSSMWHEIRF